MDLLREPNLHVVLSQEGRPFISLLQTDDNGGANVITLDDDLIKANFELTADGLVADLSIKAKATIDFPLTGIEIRAEGAPQVTADEIAEAWLSGDYSTKPQDRVMMLLQQRSGPPIPSGNAPSSA